MRLRLRTGLGVMAIAAVVTSAGAYCTPSPAAAAWYPVNAAALNATDTDYLTADLPAPVTATGTTAGTTTGLADAASAPLSLSAAPLGTFVTNEEPLPSCAYQEVQTALTAQSDYALTMLDSTYALSASYQPAGLVQASAAGLNSRELIRSIVIPDLKRMETAARAAGAPLGIASAYRSYQNQYTTFHHWVNVQGYAAALISSARPGHSEHQLGTVIDFKARGGADPWTMKDWAKLTSAGQWLAANAWKYGFVMSYPRGQTAKTCYEYEPWHYRYVGMAEAAAVRASGLTLREWLWEHQPNPEVPSP
jgi:D-alanyl-D-alanine carboxypeptidase